MTKKELEKKVAELEDMNKILLGLLKGNGGNDFGSAPPVAPEPWANTYTYPFNPLYGGVQVTC